MAIFTRDPHTATFVQYSGTLDDLQTDIDAVFGNMIVTTLPTTGDGVAVVIFGLASIYQLNPTDWIGYDENSNLGVLADAVLTTEYTAVA